MAGNDFSAVPRLIHGKPRVSLYIWLILLYNIV